MTLQHSVLNDVAEKQLGRRAELFVPATPWLLPAEWDQFAIKKLALGFLRGSKCRTAGHQLRHKIWEEQRHLEHSMQVPLNFMEGGGVSREQRNMQFFSSFVLVIENSRHKNYFSEKLLDALLARCIPVYWGCTNIGEFFDVAGFVVVEGENVEEALHNVVLQANRLSPGLAELCQEAIERNYLEASRYAGDFGLRLQQAIDGAFLSRPELGQMMAMVLLTQRRLTPSVKFLLQDSP
eukprot:g22902.t1